MENRPLPRGEAATESEDPLVFRGKMRSEFGKDWRALRQAFSEYWEVMGEI